MKRLLLVIVALFGWVSLGAAQAAPAPAPAPSCFFSYETEGDLYESTLYVYDAKPKSIRIDIVDTDTEEVLHQVFAHRSASYFYVSLEEYLYDIDATTEFVVYTNNVKTEDGGSGKFLTECYA